MRQRQYVQVDTAAVVVALIVVTVPQKKPADRLIDGLL
jgi:hypothetical protein